MIEVESSSCEGIARLIVKVHSLVPIRLVDVRARRADEHVLLCVRLAFGVGEGVAMNVVSFCAKQVEWTESAKVWDETVLDESCCLVVVKGPVQWLR